MININTIDNIKSDTLQFGLALIFSHIFANKEIFNNNLKAILLSLIGFVVYQLIIRNIINTSEINTHTRIIMDDFIKFTTVLIITKYLLDRQHLCTKDFILSTINLLIGFTIYNVYINKKYAYKLINDNMSLNEIKAISDITKFSSVFVIAGILNKIFNIGVFDSEYIKLSLGYITGLVVYDLLSY